MTADALLSILEAELDTGAALVDTLERQRVALVERDLDRITELTDILAGQFGHLNTLLQMRESAMRDEPDTDDARAAMMRRVRRVEACVINQAAVNQTLLADRLAYVAAMLGALLPDRPAYGAAEGRVPRASGPAVSRSA